MTTVDEDQFLVNSRGKKLFCKQWSDGKADNIRGLVFIIHGAAEHCGYYDEIAEMLTAKNFHVISHDHEGHGKSEGSRMHITDFNHYVEDVLLHLNEEKKKLPSETPCFLLGHSMGGLISFLAGRKDPGSFKGIIMIGPALKPAEEAVSPIKIFFGKMIARVLPEMCIIKLDSKAISRDPEFVKQYENDPLVWHHGLKARWGLELLKTLETVQHQFEEVTFPFLVLHGAEDKICSAEGSKMLFDQAKSQDKELKVYPKLFHQLHHELKEDKDEVLNDIMQWLEKRT